MTIHA
jgi:hypothetical protein